MIDVTNVGAFNDALRELARFKSLVGGGFKGRFIQIFLALKFYQNQLPSMYSGQFVSSEVLQTLLDDLFAKSSRQPNQCVLMLFEGTFLARTGLKGPGNTSSQNTWRNNFNIQKGIGCYAEPALLSSQVFLDEPRVDCQHIRLIAHGSIRGATCELCPSGVYRSEQHRKWLRIDPGQNGYATVDSSNVRNFAPYVVQSGMRLPAIPAILALYFDADPGLVVGSRQSVTVADFMSDFNLSLTEFSAYFDDDPANQFNAAILKAIPGLTYARAAPASVTRPRVRVPTSRAPRPLPTLSGTQVTPPAINSGWGAQQFAIAALEAEQWIVYDVSRQQMGYDLLAKKGRRTLYVEVKSSLSLCTPSLTSREWSQAVHHAGEYVLAILEHFNEHGANTIYWINDPANTCGATASTSVSYSISRSVWQRNSYDLSSL